ncbi:MAG: hypothetical protein ABIN89_08100 [Chitinophagaceae bacterium]
MDEEIKASHRNRYQKILPLLSERDQRILLGSDAEVLGYGGVSLVSELSGASRPTINLGKKELNGEIEVADSPRVRKDGGGRKKETEKQKGLEKELASMMEPITRGHTESVLMWTCISTRNLSDALKKRGYPVGYKVVGRLLTEMGYSLQANVKSFEASSQHPDRNDQFYYINNKAKQYIKKRLFPCMNSMPSNCKNHTPFGLCTLCVYLFHTKFIHRLTLGDIVRQVP